MLARYEHTKTKSSASSSSNNNVTLEKFDYKSPQPYRGNSQASKRSMSSPKNNIFEFGNKGGSVVSKHHSIDPFQEIKNHQMQVFKEFDNLHKNVFGKFDEMFDIPSHKSLFSGFDSIHKEMKDLMSFSNSKHKKSFMTS
jgi:hypothetical protein